MTCSVGAIEPASRQLYFNYASGPVQLLNFNPSCHNVSNGGLKAIFTPATTDTLGGFG